MAYGEALRLRNLPTHKYYNLQAPGQFAPSVAQIAKRELQAERAEARALRDGLQPAGKKRLRERAMRGRGQQVPRGERWNLFGYFSRAFAGAVADFNRFCNEGVKP